MSKNITPILDTIDSPSDVKKLSGSDLVKLSKELRQFIIDIVSVNGGHFGASLGVVELSVALHYVFNTPYDQLVWDVGHQAYGHKILTGRRDVFHTNRKYKGISGFPKRTESQFDTFGVGHSSTSIGAALGMSIASSLKNENTKQHIAVIGDGALTGGQAFEALNHAGMSDSNILVILNDNCMSIDPNVGALKEYLTDITTSHTYNKIKDEVWDLLGKFSKFGPNAQSIVQKIENAIKSSMLEQSNYFESLNFRYFGPVDGHNVEHLVKILDDLKDISGPKILHCITKKGKGYKPAEEGNTTKWHAPGIFNKDTGKILSVAKTKDVAPKYQDVFGQWIVDMANKDQDLIAITPAMREGSGLVNFSREFPERFYDVAIAEQHAVTLAAGMACEEKKPVVAIYSTFLQRAYDQLIHDVALQNLNVLFAIDRAGLVGEDGPTHSGNYDLTYLRCIPNMVVAVPADENEARKLLTTAYMHTGPAAVRYPRGGGINASIEPDLKPVEIGKGRIIDIQESDMLVLNFGALIKTSEEVAQELNATLLDMRFVKPLDKKLIAEHSHDKKAIITIEDGAISGGAGSAVAEWAQENKAKQQVIICGIPDEFVEHASRSEMLEMVGLDKKGILARVKDCLS